ncbi:unnamed protein product [Tilletia controversa]|uniref:RING-type domain-containing protein n=3 Tax=Tilletia TaxID=13289 RepID=A0A8X7MNP5_9BASI|nr:hypothetical protein CF336_g6046 [Tilletia laevis]KAE8191832.1 hypothetical protein CF328_g5558 [Tilletia controversa]KAE8253225.1 hypothetical protein A4X03_0g5957 [Tilletia caries]KAE8194470.1 hypothetical protein CF335_g5336 [Tilletia laevis]KAE8243184.1 hypothetical protein A4X06_0g6492 [Tilletia controversa]
MSSSNAASRSGVPPMAHCWQCDSDIRPLTSPSHEELTCPRCGGSFVELLPERDDDDDDNDDHNGLSGIYGGGGEGGAGGVGDGGYWDNAPGPSGASGAQAAGRPLQTILGGVFQSLMAGATQQQQQGQRANQRGSDSASYDSGSGSAGGFRYGQASIGPVRVTYGGVTLGGAGPSTARRTVLGGVRGQQPQSLSSFLDSTNANRRSTQNLFGQDRSTQGSSPGLGPQHDQHVHDDGMGGAGGASDGRFFNWDNQDRPQHHDGSTSSDPQRPDPQRNSNADNMGRQNPGGSNASQELPPQIEAIRGLFSNVFGGMPREGGDNADAFGLPLGLFAEFFGGGGTNGQLGDYVLSQEGLDNIITQLMEQTGQAHGPARASEEAIAGLERFDRSDRARLAKAKNSECATCKEDFIPGEEEAPTQNEEDDPADAEPQESTIVSLPCDHIFHEGCIVDWLVINGTCPICRSPVDRSSSSSANAGGDGAGGGGYQASANRDASYGSPIMSGAPMDGSSSAARAPNSSNSGGGGGGGGGGVGGPLRFFANMATEAMRQQQQAGQAPGTSSPSSPYGAPAAGTPLAMPGAWFTGQAAPVPSRQEQHGSAGIGAWPSGSTSAQTSNDEATDRQSGGAGREPSADERRRVLRQAAEARQTHSVPDADVELD